MPHTITNHAQLVLANARRLGSRAAFRSYRGGRWHSVLWNEVEARVFAVANAIVAAGVPECAHIALFANNSVEWSLVDLATSMTRCVSVPIHVTSNPEAISTILEETEPELVFVGTIEQARQIAAAYPPGSGRLRNIVVFSGGASSATDHRCISFSDFCNVSGTHRQEVEARLARTSPDDLWTIVYTSGTTGQVRGAMLTHGSMLFQIEAHRERLPDLCETDSSFCLLPLSHIFERGWTAIVMSWGMTNHYVDPTPEAILRMRDVRPTAVCLVPRVLEKVQAAANERFASKPGPIRTLVRWSLRVGLQAHRRRARGQRLTPYFWLLWFIADTLVLSKIRGIFGGRIKHCIVGGAALSESIHEFFLAAGLFVNTGYGLTETCATVASTTRDASMPGFVGRALPKVEVRLTDEGEILVRGPNVMRGYFKNPEANRNVFTEDGFFRTGDIGRVTEQGLLAITDRVKDLIKTSTGKLVAPQMVEARLAGCPYIEQVAVIGDGHHYLSALVVPDFTRLEAYARSQSIVYSLREELANHPSVVSFLKARIDELLADLARHERIQRIAVLTRPFSIQTGELTPTLKLRRKTIHEKHRETISKMYQDN